MGISTPTNPHHKKLMINSLDPSFPKWGKILNTPHFPIQTITNTTSIPVQPLNHLLSVKLVRI